MRCSGFARGDRWIRQEVHVGTHDHLDVIIDDDAAVHLGEFRQTLRSEPGAVELKASAAEMIHRLAPEQQDVIRMRMYQDMSFKEIAEKTGVSINTALGRMRYALINLRKFIEEHHIVLTE